MTTRAAGIILALFALVLIASRWPLAPGQLFSGDDINFAYAIGKFDIRAGHPQPPGDPVFVLETRLLDRLRVKRPESNFRILALAGSMASVGLLFAAGNRMLGGSAGFWAACLLLFQPSFWFAGLTSPVRIQLAAVSLAVALACWEVLERSSLWLYGSAIALGLGAGIRPELGPLLFPLWVWSVFKGERSWRKRWSAAGVLAAAVLAWLVPVAISTGGLVSYLRICAAYLSDQSATTSTWFGATQAELFQSVCNLALWTGSGLLALTLPAVLAWKRQDGFGFTRRQIQFLSIWIAPLAGFAAMIHVADAGHALSMVPAVCLFGGRLLDRAVERWINRLSRLDVAVAVAMMFGLYALMFEASHLQQLLFLPLLGAAAGLMRLADRRAVPGWLPVWQAGALLLLPSLCLDAVLFLQNGWYFPPPQAATGIRRVAERVWADTNVAASMSNLGLVRQITNTDDHVLRQARALAAERPHHTYVVWADGATYWPKVAYYMPNTPVIALGHEGATIRSPLTLVLARGPRTQVLAEGGPPLALRVNAGSRLIWMIGPRSGLDRRALGRIGAVCYAIVCYQDLPEAHGSEPVGAVTLVW